MSASDVTLQIRLQIHYQYANSSNTEKNNFNLLFQQFDTSFFGIRMDV